MDTQELIKAYPKLVNVVLYLSNLPYIKQLGKIKLWKLLYYADSLYYQDYNRYITEAEYLRYPHGPVPDKGNIIIENPDLIKIEEKELTNDHYIHLITAFKKPDLGVFEDKEIEYIDKAVYEFANKTATQLSDDTHTHPGWIFTPPCEVIDPLYSKYLGKEDSEGL